jgi:hypothetical protein
MYDVIRMFIDTILMGPTLAPITITALIIVIVSVLANTLSGSSGLDEE